MNDFEVTKILPHLWKQEVTIFARVNGRTEYLTARLIKNPRTLNDLISPGNLLVTSKGTLKGGTYATNS
jgi:hypothetical protein